MTAKRSIWASRALRAAKVQTLFWCAYAVVPVLFPKGSVTTEPLLDASLVFSLGLLMALRINRAYERWWEGRTLWGALVNASRNLAVKMRVYIEPSGDEAEQLHDLIAGFAFALRDHLREGAKLTRLQGFTTDDGDPDHVPSDLVTRMHLLWHAWNRDGRFSNEELRMIDLEARVFLEVAGACERIRNTPLPRALTWVTRFALFVFLAGMPWALRDELGWMIIPLSGLASFLIIVAETIAAALEDPFGDGLDQLDLTRIAEGIESSTGEILGVSRG